ncbi:MAG TPA: CoA-transferase [Methylomirabilota bacterium]|nr:CoA-transferase [Methylomirabilota bacterium]
MAEAAATAARYTTAELMATVIAREVRDGETVAVGTLAPLPATGVLLAHLGRAPRARVVIMGHPDYWPFRSGSKEFYDFAQRGGIDLFFLSGGQIDRRGNLNLVAVGDPAQPRVRLPGGAGAATLSYVARRVVVFRTEHTPRIFVERVDFVTSPGPPPPGVARAGGPDTVVTPLCVFRFDRAHQALRVASVHPGVGRDTLAARTGFPLEYEAGAGATPEPTDAELALLRTRVREAVARAYPEYAATALGGPA